MRMTQDEQLMAARISSTLQNKRVRVLVHTPAIKVNKGIFAVRLTWGVSHVEREMPFEWLVEETKKLRPIVNVMLEHLMFDVGKDSIQGNHCEFVGGPYDGQIKEVEDRIDEIVVPVPPSIKDLTAEQLLAHDSEVAQIKSATYRRIHARTARIFLLQQ